ncbi:hypothetical protein [Paenibacillus vandeheii]
MGVGTILFSDYLDSAYQVFGTILEATQNHFFRNPAAGRTNLTSPFSALGIKDIRYTNGLTEVGTTMLISHYKPKLMNPSLKSLSNPGTEKRYRKQVLSKIICNKFDRKIEIDLTEAPNYRIEFGTNFALDFLSLYEIKHVGLEEASKTLKNIPVETVDLANKLSLSFYERLNTNFHENFPSEFRNDYMSKLADAGILPYTENDWDEFNTVKKSLSKYYANLNR